MTIGFIGGGIMAEAIIRGVLNQKTITASDFLISELVESRRNFLKDKYKINITSNNTELIEKSDVIILCVKPQNLLNVGEELKGSLNPQQLLISILAGISIDKLIDQFDHKKVIRVMPNTPAQIGQGASVWLSSEEVSIDDKLFAKNILSSLGLEIEVMDEKLIDIGTALSGSGPAYVALFIESLIDAAVALGMTRDMAEKLALQTVSGTSKLMSDQNISAVELKTMVTSPGGTTAEALMTLEKKQFRTALMEAVYSAYKKSVSLRGES
ncbi:MAG: pyrroline-5-carboxylate reductase [SAR202 cluster bacterium]|nr:pyrroline-5-carboxylate reductase [Chloroflexota bacterium]MQG50533.1 pyrroline-5-carboxylate reductase [SAR202 cluster bacterium]|tara:strand:- start:19796 stop:20602 length:807 start_codon:yes stop_codon:yes gene_type:complete